MGRKNELEKLKTDKEAMDAKVAEVSLKLQEITELREEEQGKKRRK